MTFNREQRRAITSLKPFILVSAGAGSGKTRVLTERFVYLCELHLNDPNDEAGATVDEIVAITFTEKAAREMKERIRKRLAEKEEQSADETSRQFWREQREKLEYANISTFHSFCQKLLQQHALFIDLPPRFRILDEIEAMKRKQAILKRLFAEPAFFETALPLFDYMSVPSLSRTLVSIHDYIREHTVGENVIFSLRSEKMLETQLALKKLKQRELIQSFHPHAVRCVEQFPPLETLKGAQRTHVNDIKDVFSFLDAESDPNEYVETLLAVMPKKRDNRWKEAVPSLWELYETHWKPFLATWKEINTSADDESDVVERMDAFVALLQRFASEYQTEKDRRGELDFSDLQQKAITLLDNEEIRERLREKYRHVMVDEFQDTNVLQLTVLERIDPKYQFIVGDEKQSIYRFRGANVRLMNEKEEEAKRRHDADAIVMNRNYRTIQPIIEAVNELFSFVMTSERTAPYETVYTPLIAERAGEEPAVELTVIDDETSEQSAFQALASRLVEFVESGRPLIEKGGKRVEPSWSDIAILIPSRTKLLELERALEEANVPYVVHGGIDFFHRQEVVDFMTILRWLNRPFEDVHLLALLRSPLFGLTLADFYSLKQQLEEHESFYELVYNRSDPRRDQLPAPLKEACEKLAHWLETWTPFPIESTIEEALTTLFHETGLRQALLIERNGLQKVRNVEKLIALLAESRAVELETLIVELDALVAVGEKEGEAEVENVDGDFVHIMTVHASKGLEFPIVCVPSLERSLRSDRDSVRFHEEYGIVFQFKKEETTIVTPGFPIVKEIAEREALEEFKRLFYVAMTRARDYVYLIGAETNAKKSWLSFVKAAIEEKKLDRTIVRRDQASKKTAKQEERPDFHVPTIVKKPEDIPTFSVTEIVRYIDDPDAFITEHLFNLPSVDERKSSPLMERKNEGAVDPSLIGSLVHRACELTDYGMTIDAAIYAALNEREIKPLSLYEREIKALMANYDEEMRRALGNVVANEWTFATIIEGAEVVGEIDKIVEKDGRRMIVDFKTNSIRSSGRELVDWYRPQLHLYKLAYEAVTGENIDAVALYVFRDKNEPLHVIELRESDEQKLRQAIRSMVQLIQNNKTLKLFQNA